MPVRVRPAFALFDAVLLSSALLAGCGGGDGGGDAPVPDAAVDDGDAQRRDAFRADLGAVDEGVPSTPVADIEVDPLALTLVAPIGESTATADVTIRNAGDAPLTIASLTMAPDGAPFAIDAVSLPLTLAPGDRQVVQVTYTAPDADPHTGGLIVESDDPDEPRQTVMLTGRSAAACIEVMPRTIDVGAVELGQPSGRFELAARNCGDVDVHLPSVSIAGDPQFRVGLGDTEGPLTDVVVEAGRTARFDVWFVNDTLTAGTSAVGSVQITTDVADTPMVEVGLRATGQESPHCVPQFAPDRLDFGPLRIGTTRELPIDVTNAGNTPCEILNLSISHEDGNPLNTFTFSGDSGTLESLAPGETRTLTVVFSPAERDQQGNRAAVDLVYTEAGNELNRQERAFIFGVAALAEVAASQESTTFARTTAVDCASPTETTSVQNIGLVPLCLTSTRLEGDDCDAFVRTDGPEEAACIALESAASATWTYQFQPTHVGPHTCRLIVAADAMNVAEVSTLLTAEGVDTAETTDSWDVGRLNAQQRAYFRLSRPADALTIAVTVDDAPNAEWRFSNDRNSIYFEVGDHPAEGARLVVDYEARCLARL
jgi:hypothetical protein